MSMTGRETISAKTISSSHPVDVVAHVGNSIPKKIIVLVGQKVNESNAPIRNEPQLFLLIRLLNLSDEIDNVSEGKISGKNRSVPIIMKNGIRRISLYSAKKLLIWSKFAPVRSKIMSATPIMPKTVVRPNVYQSPLVNTFFLSKSLPM